MITRLLLWGLLLFLLLRAIFRFFSGVIEGGSGRPPRSGSSTPGKGEMMARDPVCGTYVVPSRAISTHDRQGTHYFCSEKCRKAFLAR